MDFGEAIREMKQGKLLQRRGWNGKNMHVYLSDGYNSPARAGIEKGSTRIYDPVVCMFTAQGTHQPGWLASQADMLAEDWQERVDPE